MKHLAITKNFTRKAKGTGNFLDAIQTSLSPIVPLAGLNTPVDRFHYTNWQDNGGPKERDSTHIFATYNFCYAGVIPPSSTAARLL